MTLNTGMATVAPGQALVQSFARLAPVSPLLQACIIALQDALAEGAVCLDLAELAGTGRGDGESWPGLSEWLAALRASALVTETGSVAFRPLVLDGVRLYFHRYWRYEVQIAEALRDRAGMHQALDLTRLRETLDALFVDSRDAPDWQKLAAAAAALQGFCLVSGGPGTGKTTTLVKLLAALQAGRDEPLRIRLAAPTGKAAARMQDAIREARGRLPVSEALRAAIPDEASTLHRLLGARPGRLDFRHSETNPLALDVLVIDEASMIDVALMAKLLSALPASARLVLLGDADQLDSVEAGRVFGELASLQGYRPAFAERLAAATGFRIPASEEAPRLGSAVVRLTRTYRFGEDSGIGALANTLKGESPGSALALLRAGQFPDLHWREATLAGASQALSARLAEAYRPLRQAVAAGLAPAAVFAAFASFRLLSPLREGPAGIQRLNALAESALGLPDSGRGGVWYPGRPVMVTRNDYALQVFNGDIGIALTDADGRLQVMFPAPDGGFRALAPAHLPEHETAYAMTVHKSQGSEFEDVLFLWPDNDLPVMSRALVYTAITRAKRRVELWGAAGPLAAAVVRKAARGSGLAARLG